MVRVQEFPSLAVLGMWDSFSDFILENAFAVFKMILADFLCFRTGRDFASGIQGALTGVAAAAARTIF